jgi:hypothetical protein
MCDLLPEKLLDDSMTSLLEDHHAEKALELVTSFIGEVLAFYETLIRDAAQERNQ